MEGTMQTFSRRSFSPEAKWSVLFIYDFLQAERAEDEGEFFQLLAALKDSTLFSGPQNTKSLSRDGHG